MSTRDESGEAALWSPAEAGAASCSLCFRRCVVRPGERGACRVRENRSGKLVSLNRNRLVAMNPDPIEKKPLFHFLPGSLSFSIAAEGCNFMCRFCQNHGISQAGREIGGTEVPPARTVEMALSAGCRSISYTYTEPTVFFETALETGVLAREKGLKNVFVTNGYLTKEACSSAASFLDAANVDLKSFRGATYEKYCGAGLEGVLGGIDGLLEAGCHLEITTLVVPGMNDGEDELGDIARFIASRSPRIPWHVSRFFPHFRMADAEPTPVGKLELALELGAGAGLEFVYIGNAAGVAEDTLCPGCRHLLVRRMGFGVLSCALASGSCPKCGYNIYGCFS